MAGGQSCTGRWLFRRTLVDADATAVDAVPCERHARIKRPVPGRRALGQVDQQRGELEIVLDVAQIRELARRQVLTFSASTREQQVKPRGSQPVDPFLRAGSMPGTELVDESCVVQQLEPVLNGVRMAGRPPEEQ